MASPKPPRSPAFPTGSSRAGFRRSESSPEIRAFSGPIRRLPPLPDDSSVSPPMTTDAAPCISSGTDSNQQESTRTTRESLPYVTPVQSQPFLNQPSPLRPFGNEFRNSIPSSSGRRFYSSPSPTISPSIPPPPLPESKIDSLFEQKKSAKVGSNTSDSECLGAMDLRRGVRRHGTVKGQGGGGGASNINEWVIPLMVFSLVCLGAMISTLVFSLNIVENYEDDNIGVFFHISDIHLDPLYSRHATPESTCRGFVINSSEPLGQYGCDSPLLLLRTALEEMAKLSNNPDFILATGDFATFNLSSSNATLHVLTQVDVEIQSVFSNPNVKIIYALGDSEYLSDGENQRTENSRWLSQIAYRWNDMLNEAGPDAMTTFKKGGYFTALIKAKGKHRKSREPTNIAVVVINTVLYSADLPDLSVNDTDPVGQFSWLEGELKGARHWGRKVIIAGHRPPGVGHLGEIPLWQSKFEDRYSKLILKYSDVISGQLFGYLHRDQFRLMRTPVANLVDSGDENPALENSKQGGINSETISASGDPTEKEKVGFVSLISKTQNEENEMGESDRRVLKKKSERSRWASFIYSAKRENGLLGASSENVRGHDRLGRKFVSQVPSFELNSKFEDPKGWNTGEKRRNAQEILMEKSYFGAGSKKLGSAILMVPSLSPMFDNRPSFRLFRYDRLHLLIDYMEHTAVLGNARPQLWGVQYGFTSLYGLPLLDLESLKILSSSFFNAAGNPTETFNEFCRLRKAGRIRNPTSTMNSIECCEDCPRHIHCSLEYSTYAQYKACERRKLP